MKKNITKKLLVLLTMVMLCFAVGVMASAIELEPTGQCGDNVYWNYDSLSEELVISGTGSMRNYEYSSSPFFDSNIKRVVIEEGVTSIGDWIFFECQSLEVVIISNSVTSIGDMAFLACKNLASFEVASDNISFCSADGVLFNKDKTILIQYPIGNKRTSYIVPDNVRAIGDYSFQYCDTIENITISESILNSGYCAFSYCSNLRNFEVDINNEYYSSVDGVLFNKDKTKLVQYPIGNIRASYIIPNSVKSIEYCAFLNCYNLKSITISDSVTHIDTYAFSDCSELESMTISDSVISIGKSAFEDCISFAEVYYEGTEEQWKKISIDLDNEYLMGAKIHFKKFEIHTHSYKESITTQPTCTTAGTKTFTCSCGERTTEIILAIVHSNATTDNGTPATCTQTGFTAGKYCPDCDTWLEGHEMIPTTAHSYTSEVTTEPTCFKDGITTYTCACGDSYTETIAKKEHEYSSWEVKTKPTCTKAGLEWAYCLNCDNDFEREIPATGHNVIEYVMRATTDEKAAYGGKGAYITACDVCNEIFKQDFFARPAEYKLSTSAYTYNGNVRKPTVTVKDADGKTLVAGQDYDVIYPDGMKLPGKYEVTVLFKGNYLGEKHLTFTIKPKATTGLKAKTQDTKSITLSWSKTTGATGYEVYKYNSQTKKYVKIKTTTSTSYKVASLNAGTTYKFKVRAYKKVDNSNTIFGGYSSVFSTATKTAKPTLKSAILSSGKVKLTWNNVSGESGYEIYYSTSKNGTYKRMSSVAANKITYTSSKLTAGKTYYFKVRTYKTVGENKVYSAFSNVKSVKIPIVYYITKTGEKYHIDGCRSLSRSKIQISYSNAVARGYKPCNACIL